MPLPLSRACRVVSKRQLLEMNGPMHLQVIVMPMLPKRNSDIKAPINSSMPASCQAPPKKLLFVETATSYFSKLFGQICLADATTRSIEEYQLYGILPTSREHHISGVRRSRAVHENSAP